MNILRTAAALAVAAALLPATGCRGIVDADAHERLLAHDGDLALTIHPTVIRRRELGTDEASTRRLADGIRARRLADPVVVSARAVPITGPWGHDQARMLRDSAASFAAFLEGEPPATEYALLAEYLFGRSEAGGIHAYLVDGQGRIAHAVLLNSHHEPFARARPTTVEACDAVLLEVLGRDLPARPPTSP